MNRPPRYSPPAKPLTTSAQRKLVRGVEQVVALLTDIHEFENSDAFEFEATVEQVNPNQLKAEALAIGRRPMPEDWSLRAGEAVQNLRAALDHATFAKSPTNEFTQFPITTSRRQFKAASTKDLEGVDEETRAIIEKHQPWNVAPEQPNEAGLELLRRMSNADKHRELVAVATAIENEAIGTPNETEVKWIEFATGKQLKVGSQVVSKLEISNANPISPGQIEFHLGFKVTIEGYDATILKGFVDDVFPALAEMENGRPLDPFAPYPITLI